MEILPGSPLTVDIPVKEFLVPFYSSGQVEFKLDFCLSDFLLAYPSYFFVLLPSCFPLLPQELDLIFSWSLRKGSLFTHTCLLPL